MRWVRGSMPYFMTFFLEEELGRDAVRDLEWRVLNYKHIQHCLQRSFYQTIKWAFFQYLGVSAPPNLIVLTGSFHQTLTPVASRLFQEQSRKVERPADLWHVISQHQCYTLDLSVIVRILLENAIYLTELWNYQSEKHNSAICYYK